jgi:hypothetical protein
MRAHVGDWLVIPDDPGRGHVRRGQVVAVPHPDGSPPFRVRWLADDHETLVFPPPDAHLECPAPAGADDAGAGGGASRRAGSQLPALGARVGARGAGGSPSRSRCAASRSSISAS